jgi:hypothetical protein
LQASAHATPIGPIGIEQREQLMALFDWLKAGKKEPPPPVSNVRDSTSAQTDAREPTEKELFQSPALLAGWVNRHILEGMPLANNYALLPDEESRKSLNITFEQRERYIREIPVLRMAGISLFIKQHYDDVFWLTFSQSLYPLLARYLNSETYHTTAAELAEAIEGYVTACLETDDKKLSLQYLHRVYDDSEHFYKLMLGGVSSLALDWLTTSYEIFRDAHCQVTQGMSYKSFKLITDAMEKVAGTPDSADTTK